MSEITLRTGSNISLSSLLGLYEAVGWAAYTCRDNWRNLEKAVANSSFVISAWEGNTLVGLARVLSDDVSIVYLQDILVHPDFQRRGIGEQLIRSCLTKYAHVRSKVLLTDDDQRQHQFYEKAGFQNTKELTSGNLNTYVQIDGVD